MTATGEHDGVPVGRAIFSLSEDGDEIRIDFTSSGEELGFALVDLSELADHPDPDGDRLERDRGDGKPVIRTPFTRCRWSHQSSDLSGRDWYLDLHAIPPEATVLPWERGLEDHHRVRCAGRIPYLPLAFEQRRIDHVLLLLAYAGEAEDDAERTRQRIVRHLEQLNEEVHAFVTIALPANLATRELAAHVEQWHTRLLPADGVWSTADLARELGRPADALHVIADWDGMESERATDTVVRIADRVGAVEVSLVDAFPERGSWVPIAIADRIARRRPGPTSAYELARYAYPPGEADLLGETARLWDWEDDREAPLWREAGRRQWEAAVARSAGGRGETAVAVQEGIRAARQALELAGRRAAQEEEE